MRPLLSAMSTCFRALMSWMAVACSTAITPRAPSQGYITPEACADTLAAVPVSSAQRDSLSPLSLTRTPDYFLATLSRELHGGFGGVYRASAVTETKAATLPPPTVILLQDTALAPQHVAALLARLQAYYG